MVNDFWFVEEKLQNFSIVCENLLGRILNKCLNLTLRRNLVKKFANLNKLARFLFTVF